MTDDAFRKLHEDGLLILPNAWDAGTARLMESLGARAVATTSAGVAWSHGYPDGDALPEPLLLATVAAIARAVRVPITVDVEGGYSTDTIRRIADAGASGINIEDGAGTPDLLCAKLERIKGVSDLFVNARTDVYLRGLGEDKVEETLARAERYRSAGADGIFVPGLTDREDIRTIASAVRMPLNVMALPGLPSASELRALGVRRLSAGAALAEVAFAKIATLASGFLETGTSEPLVEGAMLYPEINALMTVH